MESRKMTTRRLIPFAMMLMILWGTGNAHAHAVLKIVTVPWQKTETLEHIYAPLIELVGRKLETTVQLTIAGAYKEVGERLHHRAADIGITGGNAYVEAKEAYPELIYLATCKQPDAYYYSLIITHVSSDIRTISDLVGKSFGYTDIKSTSGYVYPRLMLKNAGMDPRTIFNKTYFLNKHDKVYDAVGKKVIDAGGVSITMWDRAVKRNGNVYRILSRSEPIPRNAIIAGSHLPENLVNQLRVILEQAEKDPVFSTKSNVLKGFLIKNDAFYNIVRQAKETSLRP